MGVHTRTGSCWPTHKIYRTHLCLQALTAYRWKTARNLSIQTTCLMWEDFIEPFHQ